MSRIPRTGRWLSMPARRAGYGGHPAFAAASTSRAADSTSAGSCPVVGPRSFRRIVDIPFQASVDADAAHVLLRVASYDLGPDGTPVVELVGCSGTPRVPERRLAVRAWVDGPVRRGPDASGMVSIPSLSHTDRAELARGVLPPSTPAGVALGWVARDLAGLKVGLALGAGSYRGYAHIGILRGLARMITQNRPDGSRDDPRADSSARGAGDGRLSSSRQTRAGAWVRPRPAGAAG